jgi:hypothetical protein
MPFADFGKDEETVVGFFLRAQECQREFAHAIANRHKGTFMRVKLECPFGGNVLRCHFFSF